MRRRSHRPTASMIASSKTRRSLSSRHLMPILQSSPRKYQISISRPVLLKRRNIPSSKRKRNRHKSLLLRMKQLIRWSTMISRVVCTRLKPIKSPSSESKHGPSENERTPILPAPINSWELAALSKKVANLSYCLSRLARVEKLISGLRSAV